VLPIFIRQGWPQAMSHLSAKCREPLCGPAFPQLASDRQGQRYAFKQRIGMVLPIPLYLDDAQLAARIPRPSWRIVMPISTASGIFMGAAVTLTQVHRTDQSIKLLSATRGDEGGELIGLPNQDGSLDGGGALAYLLKEIHGPHVVAVGSSPPEDLSVG